MMSPKPTFIADGHHRYETACNFRDELIAAKGELPPQHPAAGKTQVNGQATAYVCRGATCSLPITAPAGLSQALAMG